MKLDAYWQNNELHVVTDFNKTFVVNDPDQQLWNQFLQWLEIVVTEGDVET